MTETAELRVVPVDQMPALPEIADRAKLRGGVTPVLAVRLTAYLDRETAIAAVARGVQARETIGDQAPQFSTRAEVVDWIASMLCTFGRIRIVEDMRQKIGITRMHAAAAEKIVDGHLPQLCDAAALATAMGAPEARAAYGTEGTE